MNARKLWIGTFAAWALLGGSLVAKEPAEDFLNALRQRGMHATAEDYLNHLEANPALAGDFKENLQYEQAITLIDKAADMYDTAARLKELDRASEKLSAFIAASPSHPLASAAKIKHGSVLMERGKALVDSSKRPNATDKEGLRKQALEFFNQSITIFDTASADFEKQWKEMGFVDPKEKARVQLRDQLRNDVVLSLLYSGMATYESAKCHEPASKEYKDTLQAAALKFKSIYDRARKRFAGLLAGMWQGRCYQENGDIKQAVGLYLELLAQVDDSSPDFRRLKASILRLAMEAWADPSQAQFDEAVKRGTEWLDKANQQEVASVEGLGIRYFLALNQHLAIERDKSKADANKNLLDNLRKDLIANARFVGDRVGEFRKPARELLSKYRTVDETPTTFADARDKAKDLVNAFESAIIGIAQEEAKGPMADKALLEKLNKERVELADGAIKFNRMALAMAANDKDIPIDEVNACRYYLCYVFFRIDRNYESAVLGEFVATKYPSSSLAKQCANIALAAYNNAYNAARADQRQFDSDQLQRIAAVITAYWPEDDLAYTALLTLGDLAIREKNMAKAKEYLEKIPVGSPRRIQADLGAGRAIWAQYQASLRQDPPAEESLLASLLGEAEAKLKAGTEAGRKALAQGGEPTDGLLTGELSLAQLYVVSGRPELAQALLEAKSGCLELVAAKHPATLQNPIFARETYKCALQVYVGVHNTDAAERMMAELEKQVEGPDASRQLVQIYIQLGREIEDQLQVEKDPTKKDALLKGFEVFLKQIGDKSSTLNSLGWVAQTFFSLGNSLGASPKAKDYYVQAAVTLEKILKHPDLKPENTIYYQMQLAKAKRKMGEYHASANILYEILSDKDRNRVLEIQREICYTYQEWGDKEKDPGKYQIAIVGYRDPTTRLDVIWGWATISVKVQRDPKQKDIFHEARLSLADCRLKQALAPASAARRKELLDKALNDIRSVHRLSAEMGGENWRPKYDRLCKDIQAAAALPPTGLKGWEDEARQSGNTAASR